MGKPSAEDQPTRPTQPFILSGSINECELQLDVRHLNRWRRHLVNAYEVRQAWCLLQVKLCDPCLSTLKWSLPCKALYKCSALPLPFTGQPTRPTQLFILSRSINNRMSALVAPSGESLRVDGRCADRIVGNFSTVVFGSLFARAKPYRW